MASKGSRRFDSNSTYDLKARRNDHGIAHRGRELIRTKKQGAAGITTAAPYIAGQWGRGE